MVEIGTNSQKLDKWDIMVSLSSGVLTATLDVLFVKDISLADARTWGNEQIKGFVIAVAQKKGYKGEELVGAIRKLEKEYPIAADQLTNDFGGGSQPHLRDFSHHPTVIGLIFSVLTQFTGQGYGTDTQGNFVSYKLPDTSLLGTDFFQKVYIGIVSWVFHIISDIAGSSSTIIKGDGGEGTGLPGPLMSFLKEIASIPGIKKIAGKDKNGNYNFSVRCSKLFNGTLLGEHDEEGKIIKDRILRFDFRTELGIAHEAVLKKQHIPVVMNELIVRGLYSIRAFVEQINDKGILSVDDLEMLDMRDILPFANKRLTHMLALSSVMFAVTDVSSVAIKSAIKNKDSKAGFALDLFQGINYFGLGRLTLSATAESEIVMKKLFEKLVYVADAEVTRISSKVLTITQIGSPAGFVTSAIGVYQEIKDALTELDIAKETRAQVEQSCAESIALMSEYYEQMNTLVEEYLASHMEVFASGFEKMDKAIAVNDINGFIAGNNVIQDFLGYKPQFRNQDEFDELMLSEESLIF